MNIVVINVIRVRYEIIKSMVLDEWMGGWMDVKAGLRIAYSNQKK